MNIIHSQQIKPYRFSGHSPGKDSFVHKLFGSLLILLLLNSCSGSIPSTTELPATEVQPSEQNLHSSIDSIKEKGTLVIGTAITKPFEYYEPETNNMVGLDVDIADNIAGELGVDIQWIEIPFANLLPALQDEKIDIAIAGIYITPEREKIVNFSTPYLETGLIMAVHPDIHPNIHALDDLEGLNIGVKIGATGETLAEELQQGQEINITRYPDTLDSLLDLEVGRVDIVFNDYLNTLFYIKEYNSQIQIVEDSSNDVLFLSKASLGIAVNKHNQELLKEINRILSKMETDGTIDSYYQKWLMSEE